MKTVTIEELLVWSFLHELPKGGGTDGLDNANSAWRMLLASSWGKVSAFGELMAMVDVDRGGGNFWIDQGEPHGDAIVVGEAVAALGFCDVVIPPAWNVLSDWADQHGLAAGAIADVVRHFEARTSARRAAGLVSLVVGTAVLGKRPDWQADEPKVKMVERRGRPAWFVMRRVVDPNSGMPHMIETDGYNARTHRPFKGAYRKFVYSDDPTGFILSRLDWQMWVAALRRIEADVRPKLAAHRLAPWEAPMAPWHDTERGSARLVERPVKGALK